MDLTRINGLEVTVVMKLLTESGPDVSRFAAVKHFCSWLGLCPGTKISGARFWVLYKRLERGRFADPARLAADGIAMSELVAWLDGIDLSRVKRLPAGTASMVA